MRERQTNVILELVNSNGVVPKFGDNRRNFPHRCSSRTEEKRLEGIIRQGNALENLLRFVHVIRRSYLKRFVGSKFSGDGERSLGCRSRNEMNVVV